MGVSRTATQPPTDGATENLPPATGGLSEACILIILPSTVALALPRINIRVARVGFCPSFGILSCRSLRIGRGTCRQTVNG